MGIEVSSFFLKVLAMSSMISDHLAKGFGLGYNYIFMYYFGRIGYVLFAFLLVEGYSHTSDFWKYFKKMFIFALITEIPFDLFIYGSPFSSKGSNALWTFIIGLLMMKLLDTVDIKYENPVIKSILSLVTLLGSLEVAKLLSTDYGPGGVLIILIFFISYGRKFAWLIELIGIIFVDFIVFGKNLYYFKFFGHSYILPFDIISILSLIPICLYSGKLGHNSKFFKWFCYIFYPLQFIVLYFLVLWLK